MLEELGLVTYSSGVTTDVPRTEVPTAGPAQLQGLQGPSYTWAILMDARIRQDDW